MIPTAGSPPAWHFYHSDATNQNAWNVTIRNSKVTGTNQAVMLWDATLHDIVIEDTTFTGAKQFAIRYEEAAAARRVTLRRVTSTGSGQQGFFSYSGSAPARHDVHRQFPELTNRSATPGLSGGGSRRSIPVFRAAIASSARAAPTSGLSHMPCRAGFTSSGPTPLEPDLGIVTPKRCQVVPSGPSSLAPRGDGSSPPRSCTLAEPPRRNSNCASSHSAATMICPSASS